MARSRLNSLGWAGLLLVFGAQLLSCTTAQQQSDEDLNLDLGDFGLLVDSILDEELPGVQILHRGARYQPLQRPLPRAIDTHLLEDFEDALNFTQAFNAHGDNTFIAEGQQYVASIEQGYVTGIQGSVFDNRGRIYTEFTHSLTGIPQTEEQLQQLKCKRFKRLATTIQKYGHMYYHFLHNVLPSLILLRPYLDADTKILMFGASYEAAWLEKLGISSEHVEMYDPTAHYCADELLVPSFTNVITPPAEAYHTLREAFGVSEPLPAEQRDAVIYCSRRTAADRRLSNEEELLQAIRAAYPGKKLVVFTGDESVDETLALFQRAHVVLGVHGAGLSHAVFSAPGTSTVELLFLKDPPMMFWHMSAALGFTYYLVPLAHSWWLESSVSTPTQDVIDVLDVIYATSSNDGCQPGSAKGADGVCSQCAAGTYKPQGSAVCLPCAAGRISEPGSTACRICPSGSYAVGSSFCQPCPRCRDTLFPGATSESECMSFADRDQALSSMFQDQVLAAKLVQLPAFQAKSKSAQATTIKTSSSWWSRMWSRGRSLLGLASDRQQSTNAGSEVRLSMLKELFNAPDVLDMMAVEDELTDDINSEAASAHRALLQAYGSRHLLQYGERHLLQYGERRLLQSYGSRRLLQSYGERRLLQYGRRLMQYGRHLLQYGERHLLQYGRHLLQYGSRRHLMSVADEGAEQVNTNRELLQGYGERRHLLQTYGEHHRRHLLQSYGKRRHLLQYGERHLLQYGDRHLLQSYGSRHLLQYGERHLLAYADRHLLQSYGSRHLLQYGSRHLLQYGSRHLLEYGNRHLLQYGDRRLAEEAVEPEFDGAEEQTC